jgi:membrane fusion protein (multidrug efflux system)
MSARLRLALEAAGVGIAIVAAVAWLSGGCGEKIEPEDVSPAATPLPEDARVETVQQVVEPVFEEASGTLASARHTTVSSKILARIDSIPVTAGSVVEREQVVVRLDSRDLQARARAAEEDVRGARAALELARTELRRVEELHASDAASQQALDRARAAERVAKAELESAQQRLRDAQVGLSHTEIRSPVGGRVVDRLAEPGDTAVPGQPLLRIYDPGALRLEAPIRETLATRLVPGQELRVRIEAVGRAFEGAIEEIVPYAEPGARTFLVKVRLPPDPQLFAGMFGRVAVPAGERARVLVDQAAVERIGQLEVVRVVEGESASRRLVTTGRSDEAGRVEVLSGLAPGERVLVAPAQGVTTSLP